MIGQGLGRVALAEKLSIPQLQEALENRSIPAYIGVPLLEEKIQLEQRMRASQMGQAAPPQMTIADQVMLQADEVDGGIDQLPTNMMPEMAGGGIVAFEQGGNVNSLMSQMTEDEVVLFQQTGQIPMRLQNLQGGIAMPDPGIAPEIEETTVTDQVAPGVTAQTTQVKERGFAPLDVNKVLQDTETLYGSLYKGAGAPAPKEKLSYVDRAEEFFTKAGVNLNLAAEQAAQLAQQKEALGEDREEAKKMRIIEAGFAILGGTSPNAFENIGKGATQALKGYASDIKDLQKTEREMADASRKMMQAQNEIRMGVAGEASKNYQADVDRYNAAKDKMADRKASLAEKLMTNANSRAIVEAQMRSNLSETTDIVFAKLVSEGADPNDPATKMAARAEAYKMQEGARLSGQAGQDYRSAQDSVDKLLKQITSPEAMEYRRINSEQGREAAEAYRKRLIDQRLAELGRGGVQSSGAQPAGTSERVIDFGSIR